MPQGWLILGAGGHGSSVCDAITAGGDHVVGYLDDEMPSGTLLNETPVLGVLSLAWDLNRMFEASVEAPPDQVVVAIGNPALRQTWQQVLEQVAAPLGVVLHPRAIVSANASLHQGVLVNSGAVVDHDAICGAYSQLGVNAAMAGGSRLGPLACLAPGEVLNCRQTRFAALALAAGASDPGEGLTLKAWKLPQPTPELLQGFDTVTQITALAHWLRHQPSPSSARVWIATDPDHTARAVILARIALGSQGIRVGPADWPTPSPAERRKLLRDALRLTLWRATGSTGAWLAPEVVGRKRADCGV